MKVRPGRLRARLDLFEGRGPMAETGSETTKAGAAGQRSAAGASGVKSDSADGKVPTQAASATSDSRPAAGKAAETAGSSRPKSPRSSPSTAKEPAPSAKAAPATKTSARAERAKPESTKSTDSSKSEGAKPARAARASSSRNKLKEQIAKSVSPRAVGPGRPVRAAARRAVSPIATSAAQMRRVATAAPANKPAAVIDAATDGSIKAAEAVSTTVAASVDAAVNTVKDAKAKPSLSTPAMPQPPEFAVLTGSAVMTQTLSMARAFGTLQAKMLDHACAEFNARLTEAETMSRTASAAEAVVLQAKAVRRSFQSYSDHLKELARIANELAQKG